MCVGSRRVHPAKASLVSNLIFTPFLTVFTALPYTTGASQSQSKSLAVAQKKLNKVHMPQQFRS